MNRDYYHQLYDTYQNILSDKQKEYFKLYYFKDLSLSEITENLNVTRSSISKNVNLSVKILNDYEDKLEFLKNKNLVKNILIDNDVVVIDKVMDDILLILCIISNCKYNI